MSNLTTTTKKKTDLTKCLNSLVQVMLQFWHHSVPVLQAVGSKTRMDPTRLSVKSSSPQFKANTINATSNIIQTGGQKLIHALKKGKCWRSLTKIKIGQNRKERQFKNRVGHRHHAVRHYGDQRPDYRQTNNIITSSVYAWLCQIGFNLSRDFWIK